MQLGVQISAISLSAGLNNNLLPTGGSIYTVLRLVGHASGSTLTGIDASVFHDMELTFIRNDGSNDITLAHGHTSSSSGNRLHCPGGEDYVLQPGDTCVLLADSSVGLTIGPIGKPGETGPQGDTGAAGATGPAGAGFGTITQNAPSRVFDTAFQPSTSGPTMVYYHARVDLTIPALSTTVQEGYIRVKCDANNPPTTVRPPRVGGKLGITVGLTGADTVAFDGYVGILVPKDHYVLIERVTVSGSPTFSLPTGAGDQLEQVLA